MLAGEREDDSQTKAAIIRLEGGKRTIRLSMIMYFDVLASVSELRTIICQCVSRVCESGTALVLLRQKLRSIMMVYRF